MAISYFDFVNTVLLEATAEERAAANLKYLKKLHAEKGIDTSHELDNDQVHRKHEAIIDHFAQHADPTPDKRYTQWIVSRYNKKHPNVGWEQGGIEADHTREFRQEDAPAVKQTLQHFDKYKSRLENKDLNQYKTIGAVNDAVSPHLGYEGRKVEVTKHVKDAEIFHDGPNLTGYIPKTHAAACELSQGTAWCTAWKTNEHFNNYSKRGPLYILVHKHKMGPVVNRDNTRYHGKERRQFHFPSSQYMDEHDKSISLKDYVKENPELVGVKQLYNQPSLDAIHFHPNKAEKLLDLAKNGDNKAKQYVLESGGPEHHKILMGDKDHNIRKQVISHMRMNNAENPDYTAADHLVNDPHPDVRKAVAIWGNDDHRKQLLNDTDPSVAKEAKRNMGMG